MTTGRLFRRISGAVVLPALLAVAVPGVLAQPPASFNEREVKRQVNVQDKDGIWVLDFRFKDPRLITVDIPGRGRTLVWYLWYQVVNNTGQPRTFIPDLELVTLEKPHVYQDLRVAHRAESHRSPRRPYRGPRHQEFGYHLQ